MKIFLRLLAALFVFSFVTFVRAGNFVSTVLTTNQPLTITVSGNHVLVIRNFTEECCGSARGTVSVMKDGLTIDNAFVASLADPSTAFNNDPINEFVVAGPATVTVKCGDFGNCFLTYRKVEE
jgi:hypothetical protein